MCVLYAGARPCLPKYFALGGNLLSCFLTQNCERH